MSEPTVARLLFPRLDVDQFLEDQSYRDGQLALVDRGVGGFVVFSGTLTEVADAIGMLRESASQDLIFAADCEFGLAMRFGGANPFPRAMGLGNWGDADGIRRVSHAIAAEVLSVGIDWNLAPVVDINSNRGNPIVNVRSFGETTDVVSAASVAFIRGHNDAGVASCAKHFPGHGETTVDSHLRLPSVEADIDTMLSRELQPFRTAIDAGVSSIMTGHLASPLFDRSATPASLSGAAVSFLRNELAFDGVVVTDALDMGALDNGDSDEVVVRACAAGNDVLEIPANPATALDALETALQQGRIDPAAVADSVR